MMDPDQFIKLVGGGAHARMAEYFDEEDERLQQLHINEVEPYGFWLWTTSNGRKGGMVCFRGQCMDGTDGKQDLRVIDWWMSEFFNVAGGVDGLVVDCWEFLYRDSAKELNFLPTSFPLPPSFRVLYSVLPHDKMRAIELWGEDCVRDGVSSALAEMDSYIQSLD